MSARDVTDRDPLSMRLDLEMLCRRARAVLGGSRRAILGLAGPPGAGKSTLADQLASGLSDLAPVVVAMDGFHLSNDVLAARSLTQVKGAMITFDGHGYRHLLGRLRLQTDETIYAPEFVREIEEPIASRIEVPPAARLIITEGNYLLANEAPWPAVRAELDEVWYLDVAADVRFSRLVDRHVRYGRSRVAAESWARSTDARNAEFIATTRAKADLVIVDG